MYSKDFMKLLFSLKCIKKVDFVNFTSWLLPIDGKNNQLFNRSWAFTFVFVPSWHMTELVSIAYNEITRGLDWV